MRGATDPLLAIEKSRVADDEDDGDDNDEDDDDAAIAAAPSGRTSSVQLPPVLPASLFAPCQQRLSPRCRT